ncbi:hypothetical protein, partial [Serratia marcescens]|uniref:hypothetical protein n=1 Tax=Serratia marcescens TaxID=615 RepID=UPI0013DA990D
VYPDDIPAWEANLAQLESLADAQRAGGESFGKLPDPATLRAEALTYRPVFEALHRHLARLGWRSETEDDRKRELDKLLARRISV